MLPGTTSHSDLTYRRFSSDLESIAEQWASEICTQEEWEFKDYFGRSESKPFRVKKLGSNLLGFAKPGVKKNDGTPRAAHEKIASDLAYHLQLPVPPVILWDRGTHDDVPERYVCISMLAFAPAHPWNEVINHLSDQEKAQIIPVASAMLAFETLISADDRRSDHVLVNYQDEDKVIRFAFIDYAFSLSRSWAEGNAPCGAACSYLPGGKDDSTISQIADKISGLDEEMIRTVVGRVPAEFLQLDKQKLIINNLLDRKNRVGTLLGVV